MMFFQDAQYPRCSFAIRTRIIGLDPSSRVYSALVECCEDESLVKSALSPGTYPRVKIGIFFKEGDELKIAEFVREGGDAKADNIFGLFEPAKDDPNHIHINRVRALPVERKRPRARKNFEATVLHEVVHWARFHAKKPRLINGKEAGHVFEDMAYR